MKVADHSTRPMLGLGLKLTAIAFFAFMSAIIKATSESIPSGEQVFFRSFFAIPVILIWLGQRRQLRDGLKTANPMGHLWRGVIGTTAMGLGFAGLGLLPLPETTAIGFATPIFTVILAAVLLGERIRMFRISAVALGLVGVIVILSPRLGNWGGLQDGASLGVALILVATAMRSLAQIHIRQLVQTESTAAIVFYFSVFAAVLGLATLPFGWAMPDAPTLALLVTAGFLGGMGQICITSAYRFGTPSMLAPFDYTEILFAVAIGYIWFSELPTVTMLAGASLVIVAGILVIWREHRLGLPRGKARPLMAHKG
ncbi:DMT family transporter [Sulfitobacter sp. LCG007]